MQTYLTRAGDVLDDIVWRYYGAQNAAMLRAVYAANPDIAKAGDVLPAGLSVVLPDIAQPTAESVGVALWE